MSNETTYERHPSFAQISASRVSSSHGTTMYGSKLTHSRYITITLSESELVRSINTDRYHGTRQMMQVRMSENQFAQFITSLNIGDGVPCTIERREGNRVSSPEPRNEKDITSNDFKNKVKKVSQVLAEAQNRLAEMTKPNGKASKAELNQLQDELRTASREIEQNMPYMVECFEETLDDAVTSAKTDIEAYAADAFARAGVTIGSNPVTLSVEGTAEKRD